MPNGLVKVMHDDVQTVARTDPEGSLLDERLLDCIHCGLCLPYCPTYVELGIEADSPRGRIHYMRAIAEGRLEAGPGVVEHLDRCLGCRACETACPSGVRYGELIEKARAEGLTEMRRSGPLARFVGHVATKVVGSPQLLALGAAVTRLAQTLGLANVVGRLAPPGEIPSRLTAPLVLMPPVPARTSRTMLPTVLPAVGERVGRAALLVGCVMDAAFGHVNVMTARVLARNGWEVIVPRFQRCCGALSAHVGDHEAAVHFARLNLDAFDLEGVDAVVVNAAGCGAHMKAYGRLLEDDPDYADRARVFAEKVRDVTELLADGGLAPPPLPVRVRATYHDACHLAHGQGVRDEPRELLAAIEGLELVELTESDACCGSAGIYNLVQPALSARVLDRKMGHIRATDARIIAASNPGCVLQLQWGARREGIDIEVVHPIELLARAYGLEVPSRADGA
jgi:glycolate oxidase iron-sulfur subunit